MLCCFTPHPLFFFLLIRNWVFWDRRAACLKQKARIWFKKLKGLVFEWEVSGSRMSLSDRTQAKNRVPSTQMLIYCPSLHLTTKVIARHGLGMAFLIALGWRAEPQKVMLASPGEETQVTLNWQGQRTCVLDKSPDKISWFMMMVISVM